MPRIFVLTGPDVGQSFELSEGMLCGRAEDCGVRLHDASVSRHHARIERQPNGWSIVDVGSRNGLHWDGQRVQRVPLDDGREFTLGEVVLKFRDAPVTSSTPATTDEGEIELEGTWDDAKAPAAAAVTAYTPRSAPPPERRETVAGSAPRTSEKRAAVGLAAARSDVASRGVLQYQKVEARGGFLQSDFEQQPGWVKALILFAVLAVFGGLAWMGFRMVVVLRGTTAAPTAIEDTSGEQR